MMAKETNYATLNRKLIKSDLWLSETFTRGQAWVDLIMLAAYKPGWVRIRGVRVDYERGQVATSERFLCERWRWSRGKVRRFLDELEAVQQIEQQKTNASTVITITNYDRYQGDGTADETTDSTTDGTANGPQTGQQTDQIERKNKKVKEGRSKEQGRGRTPHTPPPVELPPSIRTDPLAAAVGDWFAYKCERREPYTPTGLKSFYTHLRNVIAVHGEKFVIARMQKAMASGWKGWDQGDAPPVRGSPPAVKTGPSHLFSEDSETADAI